MFETLSYSDFNDLYVIALGLSMTYILVKRDKADDNFYGILSSVASSIQHWILNACAKVCLESENAKSKVEYYIESNNLNAKETDKMSAFGAKATNIMKKVKDMRKHAEDQLNRHTRTTYLYVISYDCFLLALFIECVAPFKDICPDNVDKLFLGMLSVIPALLLHCIVYEHIEVSGKKRWFKPRLITHSTFIALVISSAFIFLNDLHNSIVNTGWIAILLVFECFIGFIAYLAMTIVVTICIFFSTMPPIMFNNARLRYYRKRLECKYKVKFDMIDKEIDEVPSLSFNQNHIGETESAKSAKGMER